MRISSIKKALGSNLYGALSYCARQDGTTPTRLLRQVIDNYTLERHDKEQDARFAREWRVLEDTWKHGKERLDQKRYPPVEHFVLGRDRGIERVQERQTIFCYTVALDEALARHGDAHPDQNYIYSEVPVSFRTIGNRLRELQTLGLVTKDNRLTRQGRELAGETTEAM